MNPLAPRPSNLAERSPRWLPAHAVLFLWAATAAVPSALSSDSRDSDLPTGNSSDPLSTRSEFRDTLQTGGLGPNMVVIEGGSFQMGCVSQQSCFSFERPIHQVRVAEFAISTHEVTFEEYDRFAAATRVEMPLDEGWGRGDQPAIWVSWDDAKSYTRWLSVETGRTYRLPTEAEWEYAARAGSVTAYSWGNDVGTGRANCRGCGLERRRTTPVGSFTPNAWGLFDVHGNVWEWVEDCWNPGYRRARPTDPRGLPRAAHAGFCVAVLGTTI